MNDIGIQVGEYVRTTSGFIAKCIEKDEYSLDFDDSVRVSYGETWSNLYLSENDVLNHSFNLIDLILVGDYVNGDKVVNVINEEPCPSGKCIDIDSAKQSVDCTLWEEDIKSIVTKEQFKAMEYEVREDD